MSSDLLTIQLPTRLLARKSSVALAAIDPSRRNELAQLYLDSYPPGVAAADLPDALNEIDATFNQEFGELRPDASRIALLDGSIVGAILVVRRSIWDAELEGPFVIDLFVHPGARGQGVGHDLVQCAVAACALAGDRSLSLRVGEGTSSAAFRLYDQLGFHRL